MKTHYSTFILTFYLFTTIGSAFAQTTAPFVPNTTQTQTTGQRTFGGGVSFTGVGGALTSCTNVGSYLTGKFSSLAGRFSNTAGGGGATPSGGGTTPPAGGGGGSGINPSERGDPNASDSQKATTFSSDSVKTNDTGAKEQLEKITKKENCLDAIALAIAQKSLEQITNRTLSWVNTGFAGNPLYVRDTSSFLQSIANQQIQTFIGQNAGRASSSATGNEVNNGLIAILTGRNAPLISTGIPNQAQQEYQSFMSDFRSGGWDNWFRTIDSRTNPIAQTLSQSQQLQNSINESKTSIIQELEQGQGFLSQKKCVEYAQISPDDSIDFTATQLDESGSPRCLRYETVTPGTVIASQVQSVTNSPIRQLERADEINEVLGGFFDQLMTQLFNKGLQALSSGRRGVQTGGFGGPGSNTIIGSNGQVLAGVGGLLEYKNGSGFTSTDFNISNPRHLAAILKTQKDFYNQAEDSYQALQKIPLSLGKLDYCMPGPTPSWQEAVESSYSGFQGAILQGRVRQTVRDAWLDPAKYALFDTARNQMFSFSGGDPARIKLDNSELYTTRSGSGGLIGALLTADFSRIPPRLLFIFDVWYEEYRKQMTSRYGYSVIEKAFIDARQGVDSPSFTRTYFRKIYQETRNLPEYVQTTQALGSEYEVTLDETVVTIERLEAIRSEALSIVKVARARHIAEKQSQGITVNLACLDQNYDVRNTPIVGQARQEADATAERTLLQKYSDEFYSTINP